jgi:membrane protein YdbS with pleckstrin-like domain
MIIGEEFHPDPKLKALFFTYTVAIAIPLYVLGIGVLLALLFYFNEFFAAEIFGLFFLIPLIIITLFVIYWIPKYYRTVKYLFTETEVRVEEGVYWKERHAIPYSRIMNVDTIQGPIARRFGIGTVDIYTAGYTGVAGGTGGPKSRRAEASIKFIPNFIQLREQVLEVVRGKPLFGSPAISSTDINKQILDELKEIKKVLEKKT